MAKCTHGGISPNYRNEMNMQFNIRCEILQIGAKLSERSLVKG